MPLGTTSKKTLRMTFANVGGASVGYTLSNPVEGLLPATVKAYMDLVNAKNLFMSSGGDLVAVKDITIVDTTTQDLYDVPIV